MKKLLIVFIILGLALTAGAEEKKKEANTSELLREFREYEPVRAEEKKKKPENDILAELVGVENIIVLKRPTITKKRWGFDITVEKVWMWREISPGESIKYIKIYIVKGEVLLIFKNPTDKSKKVDDYKFKFEGVTTSEGDAADFVSTECSGFVPPHGKLKCKIKPDIRAGWKPTLQS